MGSTKAKLSRDDVAARILKGQNVLIYNNNVLLIPNSWLDAHPGGALSILHFVGRDATDEIDAYHDPKFIDAINRYSIGTINERWLPFQPPISIGWVRKNNQWVNEARSDSSGVLQINTAASQSAATLTLESITPAPSQLSADVQARQSEAYKVLHQRVKDAGLYNTPYISGYGPEVFRYVLLGCTAAYAYSKDWQITSAIALGLMWHQLMFTVHDLGHLGVTHDWTIDRLLATFISDLIGGLSVGWWVDVSTFC